MSKPNTSHPEEAAIRRFLNLPGLNLSVLATEAGLSISLLHHVRAGTRAVTYRTAAKLLPVLRRYEFK